MAATHPSLSAGRGLTITPAMLRQAAVALLLAMPTAAIGHLAAFGLSQFGEHPLDNWLYAAGEGLALSACFAVVLRRLPGPTSTRVCLWLLVFVISVLALPSAGVLLESELPLMILLGGLVLAALAAWVVSPVLPTGRDGERSMGFSHNVLFTAECIETDEFPHPPGEPLMREIVVAVQAAGWETSEIDNWRDSGWCTVCRRESIEVEVILAGIPDGRWFMQICAAYLPGWYGRWKGWAPSATRADCYAVARVLHSLLSRRAATRIEGWCRDGYPGEGDDESTPEPLPWDGE